MIPSGSLERCHVRGGGPLALPAKDLGLETLALSRVKPWLLKGAGEDPDQLFLFFFGGAPPPSHPKLNI